MRDERKTNTLLALTLTQNPDKELYSQLRRFSCEKLWQVEVPRFDKAPPPERLQNVALIRAVGVVFSESGTSEQKKIVRLWLRQLLRDPCEKIRRYAIGALPKLDPGPLEENDLLSLLRTTTLDREKKFLGEALEKIGGSATLAAITQDPSGHFSQTGQKVRASVARAQKRTVIRMDRSLSDFAGLPIHLRCRRGLEPTLRSEVDEYVKKRGNFRVTDLRTGLVIMTPASPVKLADIYSLRCFDSAAFGLGATSVPHGDKSLDQLASLITSPLSRRILNAFTEGPIRYRLDFLSEGHQRAAIRALATRVYAKCPEILNDARDAPWMIAIRSSSRRNFVELIPKLIPDPRFSYRQHDVPAASHPPLAACMARLAGKIDNDTVWDPFCGSGLELIERALLGGVRVLYGTDRSAEAISYSEQNVAAANIISVPAKFFRCDFRDFATISNVGPASIDLIITNPPMGKRVPIPDLPGLIRDLFLTAARILRPGGRLVFANPLPLDCPHSSLKLQSRQVVDLGGFDCRLEVYLKPAR